MTASVLDEPGGWVAVGAAIATAALLAAQAAGVPLGGETAGAVALVAILALGLPHGALDLLELRCDPRIAQGRWAVLGIYLTTATAMALAWFVSPVAALAIFLAIAVVHFAIGMRPELPAALAWPFAALLIALPCASHRQAVSVIFGGLAADGSAGRTLTAGAGALAIPLSLLLAWGAAAIPIRRTAAVELAASVAALALLPPLPAFAVFFFLIHSPRHFTRTARHLGLGPARAILLAAPATLLAIGLGLILFRLVGSARPASTAPLLLISTVTVPHMFTGPILRRFGARRPPRVGYGGTSG